MTISDWKILAYVQLVYFALFAIAFTISVIQILGVRRNAISTFDAGINKIIKFYGLYFGLFILCKIAGGACAIVLYSLKTSNTNLYIATYVLDSVSISMLIKSFLPLIEFLIDKRTEVLDHQHDIHNPDFKKSPDYELPPKPKYHPFQVLTVLLLVGLILSIVASSSMDSSSASSYKTLLKASAFIFLAVILIITGILAFSVSFFSNSIYAHGYLLVSQAYILLLAMPFMLIRVIYSLLSAFSGANILSGHPSKYTLLLGDYKYYTFMAFAEECIISIILLFSMYYFSKNVSRF
ncbi:hypothetical protein CAAN1_05S01112 [[Candida] anglica]|uniref:DUF7702 domain-containing protein n=1 Tax=[Candida] anglica TaxID=148631 RepID=A0ABP0ECM7_9ASCO